MSLDFISRLSLISIALGALSCKGPDPQRASSSHT